MATHTATATSFELEALDDIQINPKLATVDVLPVEASSAGRALGSTPTASPPTSIHEQQPAVLEPPKLSTHHAWILIIQLCGNHFINCISAGFLMVQIPTIAADLRLAPNLLLWPTSVGYLASASCQLIMGSIADTVGPRRMNIVGSFSQSAMILATGLSRNGPELIAFRTLQGVASSLFGPSAKSMLSTNIAHGRLRNFSFAALALAFPLGAGLGLVLGGVYADKASWRDGYYSSAGVGFVLSILGLWTLPSDPRKHATFAEVRHRLATEIDWVGASMASASLALLSYVLAMLSASVEYIHKPYIIVLLTLSLALMPAFAVWMHYREKWQKPALIPNSLWKNLGFTSVCIMMALSNAAQTCLSYFISLFFQEVQNLSAYQASIRLLPQAVVGGLMCLLVGVFVNKVTPFIGIVSTMAAASVSPLLMAIANPAWPYWYCAFPAQLLGPLSIDVIFVVGALVVADAFSGKSQARAAAVFATFSLLGSSIGLCIMSVIAASTTADSKDPNKTAPDALLKGYRASFWTQFAWILLSCLIGALCLRKVEKVGMKKKD